MLNGALTSVLNMFPNTTVCYPYYFTSTCWELLKVIFYILFISLPFPFWKICLFIYEISFMHCFIPQIAAIDWAQPGWSYESEIPSESFMSVPETHVLGLNYPGTLAESCIWKQSACPVTPVCNAGRASGGLTFSEISAMSLHLLSISVLYRTKRWFRLKLLHGN